MKYDIFISYCRKDIEAVKALKQEIEAATLAACWMDLDGIESGNPKFTKIIIRAINACPIFLFILTEASQQSENALKELDFAYKKHREEGKKVVIVYIEPCQMNDEFSFDYGKADTIDWQNPLQREKLIRDLKKWTGYEEKVTSKKEEEENRRRQEEEQEKARQEREAARAAKLKEIDEKMASLQASIELCNTERADQNKKIDEAREQISYYENVIKTLDTTQADLRASMSALQKEKDALLGRKTPVAEKPVKKKEKDYQPYQPNTQRAEEALLQRVLSWIKQLKKKYWVHLALLAVLAFACVVCYFNVSTPLLFLIYGGCGIISICGIIQLLQGKQNGMITLLLNSAIFYLAWYLESHFSLLAYMGWSACYFPFVILLYLLHKPVGMEQDETMQYQAPQALSDMDGCRLYNNGLCLSCHLFFSYGNDRLRHGGC